jgi:hypothetical protein
MRQGRKILFIVALVVVVLICSYFLFRGYATNKIIDSVAEKLKRQYGLTLLRSEVVFIGIKTLLLEHVTIETENGDTLLVLDSLLVKPSLLALLRLNLRFDELMLNRGRLNLVCTDSVCNYSSLLKKKDSRNEKPGERNYAKALNRLLFQRI